MRITFDLACLPPLSYRATLYSAKAGIEQLEALGGRRIERGDPNAVAIQFIEPLELVAAAREVAARVRDASVLRAFAAALHTLDLLRDPQEPMRAAWTWISASCGMLRFTSTAIVSRRFTASRAAIGCAATTDPRAR